MSFINRVLMAAVVAAGLWSPTAQAQDKTLRIGFQKYGTLVILKERGALEKRLKSQGYTVTWTEFPGGPQLLEALNVGAIDFGTTGEAPPIFAQAAGAPLLYVGHEPPAPKGEALIVPKDSRIATVADLKGKRVALNKGSNVHYLLVRALEANGLCLERHRKRVPAAGRRPRRVRERQGRCLGDLGPVPGRRTGGDGRPHPDRRDRAGGQLPVLPGIARLRG